MQYQDVYNRIQNASKSARRRSLLESGMLRELGEAVEKRAGRQKKGTPAALPLGTMYTFEADPEGVMRLKGLEGSHFQGKFFSPTDENLALAVQPFKGN